MKKLLLMLSTALMLTFTGCMQFDDTRIWDAIDELEDLYDNLDGRLEKLEEECEKMNTNIEALQTLVSALQAQDTITTIAPIKQGDKVVGYTISFSKSEPITIYHGEDGKDGADGEDGKDGANGSDGYTPTIGVAKDADENYYWTLDGEWLLDAEGNKIKANGNEGKDGADGEDGEDGITPKLEIRDGYWYISYDNGQSWVELGKATGEDGKDGANGADGADGEDGKDGENGKDGADGDSLFESVTWDEEYVYFTLSDGSMIIIPLSVGVGVEPPQSTNEIWYTSTDGEVVTPYATDVFGANIVSNTYKYGKGVITFDGDVTSIGKKAFRNRKSLTNITIPEGITEIGEDAFSNCSSLASVTIPDSVTSIGNKAFAYCSSLASINIPDSVTEIGESAFYNCTGLTSVHITDLNAWCAIDFTNYQANPIYYAQNLYLNNNLVTDLVIPNNLTAIKNYGFVNCTSLRRVIIPEGVISIGSGVFDGCSSLTNITFPASVTTIDGWALADCTGLTSVTIPNTINSIGNSAFANCTGELIIKNKNLVETNHGANDNTWLKNSLFEKITIAPDNNITSIGSFAFKDCVSTTSISIPQGVTSIGFSAFKGCSSLISTNIPDSVTSIGDMAFFECSSLVDLTIPDSVVSIGDGVINRCPNLTNLQSKYASEDGYCLIVDGVLVSFSGHNLTEFTIPDGVTALGELAFYFCSNLESITIPASVTSSGDYAFQYTPALKSVHIADLAVWCSIEFNNALANPLTNSAELYLNGELVVDLVIPDSVTKIGRGSFRDCSSVISVTIPDSVTLIGGSAFSDCTSLASVYCKATTPPSLGGYAFSGNASERKIYVPTESVDAYQTAPNWSEYADYIEPYQFE